MPSRIGVQVGESMQILPVSENDNLGFRKHKILSRDSSRCTHTHTHTVQYITIILYEFLKWKFDYLPLTNNKQVDKKVIKYFTASVI